MTEDDRIPVSGWTIIAVVDTDLCARELHINLSTSFKEIEDFSNLLLVEEKCFLGSSAGGGGGAGGLPYLT